MKPLDRRRFMAVSGAAIAVPVASKGAHATTPMLHHVNIERFRFDPQVLQVRAGDTIVWHNHDIAPHTAAARDGSWDTGKLVRGDTYTMAVGSNMSGEFFCRFHPVMKGRIEVDPG